MQECSLCGRTKRKIALSFQKQNRSAKRIINICDDCWKDIKASLEISGLHFCQHLVDKGVNEREYQISEPHIASQVDSETNLYGLFIHMFDNTEEQKQYEIKGE